MTLTTHDSFALTIKSFISNYKNLIYSTQDESVASITEDGVLTANAAGTVKVKAQITKDGVTYTDTADINVVDSIDFGLSSTRTATGIVISRKTDSIEVGEDYACIANILSEMTDDHPWPYAYADDNLVKWTSSAPDVCRVKNGVLMGIAPGTATITASDLTGTVSESFDIQVVPETALSYTDDQVLTVDESAYDFSTEESCTLAIQTILADASAAGYRKVIFPNRLYQISPAYGGIYIPTMMIVDFSGATIQIMPSAMTTSGGYGMFYIQDAEYSSIENAVIYGERFLIEGTGVEGCRAINISGLSYRSGLKNCTISRSPGFNVGCGNSNRKVLGFKLADIVAGGIDDSGNDVDDVPYAFRGSTYINISTIPTRFGLGNMQGYGGYMYLSARVYNIYFYDADKTFLTMYRHCIQYQMYDKPEGAVYCRIMFWQGSAPTSGDPDYSSVAHVFSLDKPDRCYFKNCILEDNYSTGMAPNGGENFLIDNCTFNRNGYRDPSSQIDWEDGRQHNKGHILRNCTFKDGGPVTVIGADSLVVRNNVFNGIKFNNGAEVMNTRAWLNQFIGSAAVAGLDTKTDMVFSQNSGWDGASYTVTEYTDTAFAQRMAGNVFEE